jgi:hypothetical protein
MSTQPIQAGVTQVRPFSQIVAESGDKWTALKPDQKLEVLNGYLDNRAQKDPAFQGLNDQQRLEVKTGFISKYVFNQPDEAIAKMQPQGGNLGDFAQGAIQGLGTSGSFLTQPFERLFNTGVERIDVTKQPQYQQNQAFRLGGDIGNTAGNLSQFVLGSLAGPLGVLGVSANQNAQRVAGGEQNIGQAVFSTGLDTTLARFAPQSRSIVGSALQNAGIGGVAGAVGAGGNQLLNGGKFDVNQILEAAKRSALEGGAIGAGLHAANSRPATPQPQPLYQGRPVVRNAPVEGRIIRGNPQQIGDTVTRNTATSIIQLRNQGQTAQANTLLKSLPAELQARVSNEIGAFQTKNQGRQAINNKAIQTAVSKLGPQPGRGQELSKLRESIQGRAKEQNRQYESDFKKLVYQERELVRTQKEAIARDQRLAKQQQTQAVKDQRALEKAEGQKRASEIRQLRAEIKERAKLQNQKDAQTAKGNTTLQKAEAQNRARELKQLKGDIQARSKEITEENPLKGEVTNDTVDQHRENLQKAIESGKSVRMDYRAERAGTRDESSFRQKFDKPYEIGTDNSGEYVRVINENGQFSKRYLDSIRGSIEVSADRFPYSSDSEGVYARGPRKGERGRSRVLDEDGNEVEQGRSNLTKDSIQQKKIDDAKALIARVEKGEKVKNQEINTTLGKLSETEFNQATKDMSQKQIDEIGKDIGC